jgi:phosphatidylglycerophosphatase A
VYAAEAKTFDPSECVVDELAGQWIACAFAPVSPIGFALAFVLFRLFDIWKPWPIPYFERWHGGLGIMADDVVAALMGGIILVIAERTGLI